MTKPLLYQNGGYFNRHSRMNKIGRILWGLTWFFLFRPSPRWMLNNWRRRLLALFGAKMHGCSIHPSVHVWVPWNLRIGLGCAISEGVNCYCVAPISIGNYVTISRDAFLCSASHDISSPNMELISAPIVINDYAWICSRVFIGPGVTIGEGAVVGACSVVTRDVEPWTVVGGNPAKFIKKRVLRGEDE